MVEYGNIRTYLQEPEVLDQDSLSDSAERILHDTPLITDITSYTFHPVKARYQPYRRPDKRPRGYQVATAQHPAEQKAGSTKHHSGEETKGRGFQWGGE